MRELGLEKIKSYKKCDNIYFVRRNPKQIKFKMKSQYKYKFTIDKSFLKIKWTIDKKPWYGRLPIHILQLNIWPGLDRNKSPTFYPL